MGAETDYSIFIERMSRRPARETIMDQAVKIPRDAISENAPHDWSAFASDLGLRPGVWPHQLVVDEKIGNGMPLLATKVGEDHAFVRYTQHLGCVELTVFND